MWHSPGVPITVEDPPQTAARRRVTGWRHGLDTFVLIGLAMVGAQLCFRGWAVWNSWFAFDDLAFISKAMNEQMGVRYLTDPYGGHLMPAGFFVIWYLTDWFPSRWEPWALLLIGMQALASLGMFRLLISMFGRRWTVLGLLALYLTYVITVPAFIWWAAGINQLPFQIALVFGLHAFLDYLRSRRIRPLVVTAVWSVVGLAFYEKSLLIFVVYAVVALAYFGSGSTPDRLQEIWTRYRRGVLLLGGIAVGYFVLYVQHGLQFAPDNANQVSWGPIAVKLVFGALTPALVGGPLRWQELSLGAIAHPPAFVQVLSWVAVAGLVLYAARTRTKSVRAWLPLVLATVANIILLSAGRAFFVGPDIALEYRYQTEAAALFVIGAGLALLPLRGAAEVNELRPDVPRPHETPMKAMAGVAVVCVLSLISTGRYVVDWQQRNPSRAYYETARSTLESASVKPVPLVDLGLPLNIMWAYRYPENTDSHALRMFSHLTSYRTVATDQLYVLDDTGAVTPMTVTDVRSSVPQGPGCSWKLNDLPLTIPLDGPVIGGGWWVEMDYSAPRSSSVEIVAGTATHAVTLKPGSHTLWFSAEGSFDKILVRGPEGKGCIISATLGLPVPADSAEQ